MYDRGDYNSSFAFRAVELKIKSAKKTVQIYRFTAHMALEDFLKQRVKNN